MAQPTLEQACPFLDQFDDSTTSICGVAIPKDDRVWSAHMAVQESPIEYLPDIKKFLMGAVGRFKASLNAARDKEYETATEVMGEILEELHLYCGGLLGLATSLLRRIKAAKLEERTKKSNAAAKGSEEKFTAQAIEYMARGDAADLEGLVELLDQTQRNLYERMQVQRGRIVRGR